MIGLVLFICFVNLAATITVAWRFLELERELSRRSSINHDITQQIPVRKRRKLNYLEQTTQNIRIQRRIGKMK